MIDFRRFDAVDKFGLSMIIVAIIVISYVEGPVSLLVAHICYASFILGREYERA